jgi:hypothetical protein
MYVTTLKCVNSFVYSYLSTESDLFVIILFEKDSKESKRHIFQLPKSKIPVTGSRKILQKRRGKVTGFCREAPKFPGTGSSIPVGNCPNFFRWISVNFLSVPAGTSPYLLTWVIVYFSLKNVIDLK